MTPTVSRSSARAPHTIVHAAGNTFLTRRIDVNVRQSVGRDEAFAMWVATPTDTLMTSPPS